MLYLGGRERPVVEGSVYIRSQTSNAASNRSHRKKYFRDTTDTGSCRPQTLKHRNMQHNKSTVTMFYRLFETEFARLQVSSGTCWWYSELGTASEHLGHDLNSFFCSHSLNKWSV